jgi:rSAM/selenodomain-associated transferase 1
MRRACVIVAKAPQAGYAKTRLVPPLSAEGAARLYAGFLLDAVALGLGLGWEQVSVIHPVGSRDALAELLPTDVRLVEQPARGLQAALSHAFEQHLSEGFERVVLIGSDNPTLTASPVVEACQALDRVDVAIGPSADGGYYLLGMKRLHPELFQGIAWSTSRVCAQTVSAARGVGLAVAHVAEWFDVDDAADLARLERELASSPSDVAPYTRRALETALSAR